MPCKSLPHLSSQSGRQPLEEILSFLPTSQPINDYLPNMYFVPPLHPASTCQEQMVARGPVEVACATGTLVVVERMSACKLLDQF